MTLCFFGYSLIQKFLPIEIAGKSELLTYKAACASHMYGQRFDYVVDAYNCLDKKKNRDMLLLLQMHMQTSTGFYSF